MSVAKKSKDSDQSEICNFDFICDCVSKDDEEMLMKIFNNYIPSEFNVPLLSLCELVIANSDLALVMRNSLDEDPDSMDIDTEESSLMSLTTVLSLNMNKTAESIVQFFGALNKQLVQTPKGIEIMDILENPKHTIGLIINERIINNPLLTIRVLETLFEDIKSFQSSDKNLRYTHYCIMLCCSKASDSEIIEFFHEEMKAVYDTFTLKSMFRIESETNVEIIDKSNKITTHGYRAFIVFESERLDQFMACIKSQI